MTRSNESLLTDRRISRRRRLLFTASTFAAFAIVALVTGAALLTGKPSTRTRRAAALTESGGRMSSLPPVILWAWERPEDLDFINTDETGVAFLARTLYLRGEQVVKRPRLQPLKVSPRAALVAVVRIESDKASPPSLSPAQRAATADAIVEAASQTGVRAVQVDFDAVASERDFYRQLLFDVRGRLPQATGLSMTALASWCAGDDWLAGLPVDEAVPMLFRMGADERQIHMRLSSGVDFRSPVCRSSYGLATDEAAPLRPSPSRRLYLFNTRSWTPALLRKTLERYRHEQQHS